MFIPLFIISILIILAGAVGFCLVMAELPYKIRTYPGQEEEIEKTGVRKVIWFQITVFVGMLCSITVVILRAFGYIA